MTFMKPTRRAFLQGSAAFGATSLMGSTALAALDPNSFAVADPPHPHCQASRGANGIDGQVATFLGLSDGEGESWGIVGDLTTLYDLNAPALLPQLAPAKRRLRRRPPRQAWRLRLRLRPLRATFALATPRRPRPPFASTCRAPAV